MVKFNVNITVTNKLRNNTIRFLKKTYNWYLGMGLTDWSVNSPAKYL